MEEEPEYKEKLLEDLKLYLGVEHSLMDVRPRIKLEETLKRTVRALEAGATPQEIKEVVGDYISDWQPDRTYG